VLDFLIRTNFLQHFVFTLREDDPLLQAMLEPTPDSLNAMYIFEAKMTLFLRISQTKLGAESLLASGLLDVLSDCRFIDFRFEEDFSLGKTSFFSVFFFFFFFFFLRPSFSITFLKILVNRCRQLFAFGQRSLPSNDYACVEADQLCVCVGGE